MEFSSHLRQVFAVRGRTSIYAPLVGDPVTCKAIRQGGGQPIRIGPVVVTPQRVCFHVRRADIAAPVVGATLVWGGETFTVEAVQPVERDSEALLWALEVEWGAAVIYRSVTGSGAAQNPPQGSGFTIAAAALAGAATISIKSVFTAGKLLAGDSFTIAGDPTIYAVTGAGVQAASNQFTNVPITPVLATNAALGAAVTFYFARDYPVRAAVANYEASEFAGGVKAGDRRLVIMQAGLTAAGMTDQPQAADKVTLAGKTFSVLSAVAIYQGADPYGWDVQVGA